MNEHTFEVSITINQVALKRKQFPEFHFSLSVLFLRFFNTIHIRDVIHYSDLFWLS